MGQVNSSEEPVKPELLVSELIGEVTEDDYYARSITILDNFTIERIDISQTNKGLSLDDAYLLANPGYLSLEHGYTRLANGTMYIAVLTNLGQEINGKMFDWWFCNVDNKEKYRWWHPRDHIDGNWDPQYYAIMPQERSLGHYINHIHIVKEKINNIDQYLHIEFERPSKYFDITKFNEQNITACLVARIHTYDSMLGMIAIGHLIHIVRTIDDNGNSELRSRFWLGDINYPETSDNIVFANMINNIANTYLIRYIKASSSLAYNILKHCSEEMHCLKEILPDFYKRSTTNIMINNNHNRVETDL